MDSERGTGRTTRQLQRLKRGGLYLAFSEHEMRHHRVLARNLGLGPFAHMTLSRFIDGAWQQVRYPDFDMDHHISEELFLKGQTYWRLQEILDYLKKHMPDAVYFRS